MAAVLARTRMALRILALAAVAGAIWCVSAPRVEGQQGARPRYSSDGKLLSLPAGFETWVFVGSNLGMAYDKGLAVTDTREAGRTAGPQFFHNVYINPEAYAHFAATGEFPDPTILVMEVYLTANKDTKGVLAAGVFNGERKGVEVAVKDTRRPSSHYAPGDTPTPWTYYIFMNPFVPQPELSTTAPAQRSANCQQCHKEHAGPDNVWVQFYPTLRKLLP
jgi:hypothetical protein